MEFLTDFEKNTSKLDGISVATPSPKFWISLGNYVLNKVVSGRYDGGIPQGKLAMLAGPSGSGKSFLAGNIIKAAQNMGYVMGSGFARNPSPIDPKYIDNVELLDLETLLPRNPGLDFVNNKLQEHLGNNSSDDDDNGHEDEDEDEDTRNNRRSSKRSSISELITSTQNRRKAKDEEADDDDDDDDDDEKSSRLTTSKSSKSSSSSVVS